MAKSYPNGSKALRKKGEIARCEQFLLFPRCFQKDLYCWHVKTRACLGKAVKTKVWFATASSLCCWTLRWPLVISLEVSPYQSKYHCIILISLLTLSLLTTTQVAFVDSVDQDQTAQNVQPDLWSTQSIILFSYWIITKSFLHLAMEVYF